MKLLLLADLPPCTEYTGGQVLYLLAKFLKPESLACYITRDPNINPLPTIAEDLADIPIIYDSKPDEFSSRSVKGKAGLIESFATETYRRLIKTQPIRRSVVRFGKQQGVTAIWAVLQGQTTVHLARLVAADLGVPLYTQVWDPLKWWLLHRRIDRFSTRRSLFEFDQSIKSSSACMTASLAMAEHYESRYGTRSVPVIFSLPRTILVQSIEQDNITEPLIIGMAGQVYAQKEFEALIRTLNLCNWKIDGHCVEIHYAGGGIPEYLEHANIKKLGWLTPNNLVQAMARAHVLYLPYWFSEDYREAASLSFPSKLVIYFAASQPVLFHGPDYASPSIYLKRKQAGIICNSLIPSDIYNTLSLVTRDIDLRGKLRSNGRAAFLSEFTLEAMASNFYSALQVPIDRRVNINDPIFSGEITQYRHNIPFKTPDSMITTSNAIRSSLLYKHHKRINMKEMIKQFALLFPIVRHYVEKHRLTVVELEAARIEITRLTLESRASDKLDKLKEMLEHDSIEYKHLQKLEFDRMVGILNDIRDHEIEFHPKINNSLSDLNAQHTRDFEEVKNSVIEAISYIKEIKIYSQSYISSFEQTIEEQKAYLFSHELWYKDLKLYIEGLQQSIVNISKFLESIQNIIISHASSVEHNITSLRTTSIVSELWYRDLMVVSQGKKSSLKGNTYLLETDHPIATNSIDHRVPWGTAVDNTRWPRFVGACERIINRRPLHYMDLGCAGGGLVLDFQLAGHYAVGIEGSDFSLNTHRAEWRTIAANLFTADIAYNFRIIRKDNAKPVLFDIITAWDVMEHIYETDLNIVFNNITLHLANDGYFIGTIAIVPDFNTEKGVQYHPTVRPKEWWFTRFSEAGLEMLNELPLFTEDFCRGIGNPYNKNDVDYRKNAGVGFQFMAKIAR